MYLEMEAYVGTEIIRLTCAKPEDETKAREIFASEFQIPFDMVTPDGQDPTVEEMEETAKLITQFSLTCIANDISLIEIVLETEHRKRSAPLRSTMEIEISHLVRQTIRRKVD